MNRKPLVAVLSALMFLLIGTHLWGVPTYGEPAPGVLRGTTLDASGLAAPQVQVTIHSVDENADRVVVSDRQGSFVVGNLKPGHYQLVATKQGGTSSPVTYVAVAAG
ncbi:MAG: carboxypeptidase-like regulatory domain-containing protein, partial [Candidatus Acidiferrales bacterium]